MKRRSLHRGVRRPSIAATLRVAPQRVLLWSALALLLAGVSTTLLGQSSPTAVPARADVVATVDGVESVAMTVSDMDRSLDFYTRVLGFVRMSDEEIAGADFERLQGVFGARARVVRLGLGDERLDLIEYLAPRGRSIPADARANDAWFQHVAIVVSDMDRAYERLRTHRVTHASTGPQTLPAWNPNAGGIRAFYFKDPDGHTLEILQFPTGKGDTKWHKRSDALFLGIDHTAIVTRDTDLALALYRDVLGLRVAGESENWGDEQEHLNNVFGARLRITTLKGLVGPGIELLEYLAPRDGRPYPADAKPNDILHWQTRLTTRQLPAALGRLRSAHVPFVSPGLVELSHARLGFTAGVLVRDPDGHALQLTNPPPGTSPHQSPSRSPR